MRTLLGLSLGLYLVYLLASGCTTAPKVKVCVSYPAGGGMDCYDQATGESSFVDYNFSDRYVAFPPSDAKIILDFCASGRQ